jgi:preprotein translocase subunit SecF
MTKSILTLTSAALFCGLVLTNCNTPTEKVDNAEEVVIDANIDANNALEKANQEYLKDMENFRIETAEKFASNDKSVIDFNTRIVNEKKEAKANYQKQITDLEQKSSDMKKRIDDYKAEGKEKWNIFKTEFNHDMDELGLAFKDLTIKNVN